MSRILILGSIVFTLIASASAKILFYEGFDYPIGESLDGKKGGVGFSDAWNEKRTNGEEIVVEGLSYGGNGKLTVKSVGGGIRITPDPDKESPSSNFERCLKNEIDITSEVWFTFLLKAERVGKGHLLISLAGNNLFIGKPWAQGLRLSRRIGGEEDISIEINQTFLVVVKISAQNEFSKYEMWVNPDSKDLMALTNVRSTYLNEIKKPIEFLRVDVQSHGGGSYILDEFRMATSWEELFGDKSSETPNVALLKTPEFSMPDLVDLKETGNDYLDKLLKETRAKWVSQLGEAVGEIDKKFIETLESTKRNLVKENRIAEAQAYDNAIKGVEKGDGEPAGLLKLREARADVISKTINPINRKYWERLKEIREAFQDDGSLEGVVIVDEEIQRLIENYRKAPQSTE